ncbi:MULTISPECIES: Asp-tRNA(Asn)/Glu-tRNA(Gln) amidotransferase subunit GatB [Thermodesulfovibrio]|uniref:Aspartyl/glutamyl-tRNA(Asn/Gln) amidotransferase subunit B n=1 Tax=Thermodesulfovibrio yellowstonii (strain ATCC 51303 / DSM 11347 / YP87) TaxID=289376 RepID=GATB_THEYD|nr:MULTISPECIES: Asp-tRNA(Asn)/Glu-tRNA(Gln) amidotransferase subunit GatB [Thermodesulfovibrio]B5YL60.1 RecName: Full=Aspartyl/glutamyl-tRNA(Asn/Gln) amidotransferase subunit B; Short=Asp/Glu-ADT subunit B [Thermodesulfovibrio yellowstonii DSM 11347]ACI20681.1 glu-trnagln amidotransferase suBunit b [Thermodesulfovibrio yellowstonii DSM 11347]MDI6864087.1 Asp-tRNA(Asn)/Glu-tRNA(Gln) amidotransferase subunit GatB [Thermodesulfovibrio yellowstonii]
MQYEAVIGLEVHAQLLTESKIFCGCSTQFGAEPNTQVCPVCLGMPGVLPVLNKKAVEYTVKTGLAMNCKIAPYSRFARKNYFYPDLPKGYQISQYELPLCEDGYLEIMLNGTKRKIRIKRIHLEEDAGKNIHDPSGYSFVDFNRTGVPLMEIVSEPDIRSPKEAALYMKKLRAILRYLGVCDGNLEQGSLRCDANVSVRPVGSTEFGVKTEIKNINSFRFVEKALEYEIKRQIKLIENGEKIIQETRLWDSQTGTTQSMRSKEEAHDYRYFPEPDLVPVVVSEDWIEKIKKDMPELPDQKIERFIKEYGLPQYDSEILTEEKALSEWFEEAVKLGGKPKEVANWIMVELLRLLNEEGKDINECSLKPIQLVELIELINKGTINRNTAKEVFEEMYKTGKTAEAIVREKGLTQISDDSVIIEAIKEVMNKNPKEVERFRNGEEKLIGFFVGQVMKITKGKANPKLVNELIFKILKE